MIVIKRDGRQELVKFDKITSRLKRLCKLENSDDDGGGGGNGNFCEDINEKYVDVIALAKIVIGGLFSGVKTHELDTLAAETSASMALIHPDYTRLASRIAISNLHRQTCADIKTVAEILYRANGGINYGINKNKISSKCYLFIMKHADALNNAINHMLDYDYNYFGFRTLERSYLLRVNNDTVERPQHMLMRVAIGINAGGGYEDSLGDVLQTYRLLSQKYYTHATPTLFSAGTDHAQMSSCFLMQIHDDSIKGIYKTLNDGAIIAQSAGGIGLSIHNIRGAGSVINSSGGKSSGIVPMLRVFNNSARYVDQGGRRPGSYAIYLEPWHCDIMKFVQLRRNNGKEEERARDLFYALWINDLFMRRVCDNAKWSLMCPKECPGLDECYGKEFDNLYMKYESEDRFIEQIDAQKLWHLIALTQIETGMPYILFKDTCNAKSNQKNLGTIKSSNLCAEIIQYTSRDEIAVCNLASISLPRFVRKDVETGEPIFDFLYLKEVAATICYNLNKVIDNTKYPLDTAQTSNLKHRPIGIGVQGLANAFMLMRLPYDSLGAAELNKRIFETIYFGALEKSCEMAEIDGPYSSYENSPVSMGLLQFDMWENVTTQDNKLWNWPELREKINLHGLRNSLLTALMPTASTAQLLDNFESFEPCNSNLYSRKVSCGEFQLVNKYLLNDLTKAGLWDENMKNLLVGNRGSIQNIQRIPEELRNLYKTVWEIPLTVQINMAADRGPYIDQSQSFNIHMAEPTYQKITSCLFYGWRRGLKTGLYYLRSKPAVDAIQFTLDAGKFNDADNEDKNKTTCSRENADCEMCSG